MSRISARFAALKAAKKKALITFTPAGDPDLETFAELLAGLPKAGADLIEIGMPFSDPVADGPVIETGNLRAFKAGVTMRKILDFVADFRENDNETPVVLMGYANPVYHYGIEKFAVAAKKAGVDGMIVADLPPEEDADLRAAAKAQGLDIIHLVTPTTDEKRLDKILKGAGGFLYYVSVAGTTGTKQALAEPVHQAISMIRPHSTLPLAVGFGISTPDAVRDIAEFSDAVIVGSAIVSKVAENLDSEGAPKKDLVKNVLTFVQTLADATHAV